jgi:chloride channel protein, CIC family
MVCCIISTLLAMAIKKDSIYTIKLKRTGVDLSGGMEQGILLKLKVKNHMSSISCTINENATLDQIMEAFKSTNVSYLHVIDAKGHLTGIISIGDIRPILDEQIPPSLIIARGIATLDVKTITLQLAKPIHPNLRVWDP